MKKVIFALAICATIVSCQKKEDTDPIDVSKTAYVMNNGWQLKKFTWRPNIADSSSFPQVQTIPGCQSDDFLRFYSTNRVSLNTGISKCNIGDPDSTVYGYTFTNNDSHLEIYTDPDASLHDVYLGGDMQYPSIDTFIITYHLPNQQDSSLVDEYVKTYVRFH